MTSKNQVMTLGMDDFAVVGDKIIFSSFYCNGLFQADLKTGKAELIGLFPNEELWGWHLYNKVHIYEKCIIFVPCWGKEFAFYNMETNVITKLPCPSMGTAGDRRYPKFYTSILVEKYLYAFGAYQPEIVRIDMDTMDIRQYTGWNEGLNGISRSEDSLFFNMDVCRKGKSIYIGTAQDNTILELNTVTDKIILHRIGREGVLYHILACDGKYFWSIGETGEIVRVDSDSFECTYIETGAEVCAKFFFSSLYIEQGVWIFSGRLDSLYRISCEDFCMDRVELIWDQEDWWLPNRDKYGYSSAKIIGEHQFAVYCSQDSKIHILENGKEISAVKIFVEDTERWNYENQYYQQNANSSIIIENGGIFGQLRNYINYLEGLDNIDISEKKRLNIGEKTFHFVMNESNCELF